MVFVSRYRNIKKKKFNFIQQNFLLRCRVLSNRYNRYISWYDVRRKLLLRTNRNWRFFFLFSSSSRLQIRQVLPCWGVGFSSVGGDSSMFNIFFIISFIEVRMDGLLSHSCNWGFTRLKLSSLKNFWRGRMRSGWLSFLAFRVYNIIEFTPAWSNVANIIRIGHRLVVLAVV